MTTARAGDDQALAEYQGLRRRLGEQLAIVRAQFQEAVACYSVKVQGALTQVGEVVAGDDPDRLDAAERAARVQKLRRVIEEIERLDLRPSKGRRRDLKAVQNAATYLSEAVAEW